MRVAIIPARIGSKRILKKNIKIFFSKPIIYWVIQTVKATMLFDKIIVSTDSEKIRKIARKYKVDSPFLRPKKISNDKAGIIEVIRHSILWLKKNNIKPKYVCCIFPTAIFVSPKHIINAYKKIRNKKWNYVFAATSFESSPFRSFQKNSKNQIEMLFPKNYNKRTQELPKCFYDAGQFYWGKINSWLKKIPIFGKKSSVILLPNEKTIDINTKKDWLKAIELWKKLKINFKR